MFYLIIRNMLHQASEHLDLTFGIVWVWEPDGLLPRFLSLELHLTVLENVCLLDTHLIKVED